MCVAVSAGTAALVGGTVISGAMQADAAGDAADTQANAQRQAAQTQVDMFNKINKQEQPFIQSGYGANAALNQLLGLQPGNVGGLKNGFLTQQFNPTKEDLQNYPGYKFALDTGTQAVRNSLTPTQGALSGATLKDMTKFAEDTANTYYGNYFNQFETQRSNIFNRLSGILGLGQNAASQVGTAGTSLGSGIAGATAAAGGSQAAGQIGAANAYSGAINNGTGMIYLNSIMNQGNSGGGGGGGINYGTAGGGGGANAAQGFMGGGSSNPYALNYSGG